MNSRSQAMVYRAVAKQFAAFLARSDHAAAWTLLAEPLKSAVTPEVIKTAVATMTACASGPIREAQVIDDFTLEDWPGKQAGDLAVVYVALNGDSFSEAVTLTLAQYGDEVLIRDLAWGRP